MQYVKLCLSEITASISKMRQTSMAEQMRNRKLPTYMNRWTGGLLARMEMLKQFDKNYDGNDPTNAVGWDEYFEEM